MKTGMIVVVDDEQVVTSALKMLFRVEGFTNGKFFNNPLEALEFLKNNEPDVIVSDVKMPEMNGVEFLTEAKKLYPDVSKILLTGYADKENAIQAINEVGIYKYLEKPWDNDDLIITIKNGIERSNLIKKLNEKISELEVAKAELEKYSHNLEDLVKEKTADILVLNSKMSNIINYCADGIITININGEIEQVNPACENMTGLSAKHLEKMKFSDIAYPQKGEPFTTIDPDEREIVLRDYFITNTLSGKATPVEISLAMIESEDESLQKYVGVIRDVSVQKETERLRDDFIATLTHDMRTPLLAAIQTLKFFLDGTLGNFSEKATMLLSTLKTNNENLLGLVNSLLEVYRYDSGKLELVKTHFEFKGLCDQCYNELKPLADKKDLEFILDYQPDEKMVVNADRSELRRVITNLCGNAINYTNNNGKIIISVKQEDNDIVFSVIDNGNGIPKEDIPSLFKRFSQGTSKKRSTGTGLGLYLSRQIVEAHGGKIWLESKLNKGSEFSFLLTNVVVPNEERVLING